MTDFLPKSHKKNHIWIKNPLFLDDYKEIKTLLAILLHPWHTTPFTEERNAIFVRLEETAACANLTKEEGELYEEQWRNYNDYYNTMHWLVT